MENSLDRCNTQRLSLNYDWDESLFMYQNQSILMFKLVDKFDIIKNKVLVHHYSLDELWIWTIYK